ncbi:hypothetical protein, partial [Nocardia sp. NPDC003354]
MEPPERRRGLVRRLRDRLFPRSENAPLGEERLAAARVRWDEHFEHAHAELARLPEEQRAPFAYEAGQIMAGRHQAPPPIRSGSAGSSAEAEYAALHGDMMALITHWSLLHPSPGIPLEERPAYVLSELLREDFGTRATSGGVAGAPGPVGTRSEELPPGEGSGSGAQTVASGPPTPAGATGDTSAGATEPLTRALEARGLRLLPVEDGDESFFSAFAVAAASAGLPGETGRVRSADQVRARAAGWLRGRLSEDGGVWSVVRASSV